MHYEGYFPQRLPSAIAQVLKEAASSQKPLSVECVKLYLMLPAYILQPLDKQLFAVFAQSLTSLAAELRAVVGECGGEGGGGERREERGKKGRRKGGGGGGGGGEERG